MLSLLRSPQWHRKSSLARPAPLRVVLLCLGVVALTLGASLGAYAATDVGVGPILGDPLGISAKAWLDSKRAVDLGVGRSVVGPGGGAQLHVSFLLHEPGVIAGETGRGIDLYFGFGPRVRFDSGRETELALRLPVGLTYLIRALPIDLFAELAPLVVVAPGARLSLQGAVGARYYFSF